jgi:hypothetical protein
MDFIQKIGQLTCAIGKLEEATSSPGVTVNTNYIPNSATGFFDKIEDSYTNGILTNTTTTATTIPCEKSCVSVGALGQLTSWGQIQ